MLNNPVVVLEYEAATRLLQAAQTVLILAHVRPDGDAIGSMCGLGLALEEMGKTVTMAVDEGINAYLSFVPAAERVLSRLENPSVDLVIACDASDLARLGEVGQSAFALDVPKIVVDHHATNPLFGDVHIVNADFVSTTEAVLRWLDFMGWKLSPRVAQALLVGFMTDTISFRVGPVVPETLAQVQRLMNAGANLREVIERMLIRVEAGQLQLLGRGLANCLVEDHVAWTYLRLKDFDEMGRSTAEKPELSTEILRDERAYIAAFFLETEEGDVRLSLRATPGFDIGRVALGLGGGGHTLAAGVTLEKMSLEQAIAQVLPLLKTEAQRGIPLYK